MREHHRKVYALLKDLGATDIKLTHGGKHPKMIFFHNGRERSYTMPSSPGDCVRGIKNAKADLRRLLT